MLLIIAVIINIDCVNWIKIYIYTYINILEKYKSLFIRLQGNDVSQGPLKTGQILMPCPWICLIMCYGLRPNGHSALGAASEIVWVEVSVGHVQHTPFSWQQKAAEEILELVHLLPAAHSVKQCSALRSYFVCCWFFGGVFFFPGPWF